MKDWASSENFRSTQILLRDCRRRFGIDKIRTLLPKPFFVTCDDHDTGSQGHIDLTAEGMPTVEAWRGSVWYSSIYEFNDTRYIKGVNPEVADFAMEPLNAFFEQLQNMLTDANVNALANETAEKMKTADARSRAIYFYRQQTGKH